jgi:hypothetical protein
MSSVIPRPEGAPQFKFEESTDSGPNTIQGMRECRTYLVSYTDGAGKPQVRIAVQPLESKAVFMAQEKISGHNVFTSAHEWFEKAFNGALSEAGEGSVESV